MYIKFKKPFIIILIFVFSFGGCSILTQNYEKVVVSDLAKSVIRFHVLANSDSAFDQSLKLEVKDAVVNYLENSLEDVKSTDDASNFLQENTKKITTIASNVVIDNGYDYKVSAKLGKSDFPDKSYGDVTFPSGTYNSFIITIGEGAGHNWWCVLYPPLCFVDASTGVLPETSKETLKDSISASEYNYVTDSHENNVHFEFKYLSFLNDMLN